MMTLCLGGFLPYGCCVSSVGEEDGDN
jgi:hypothetical protein